MLFRSSLVGITPSCIFCRALKSKLKPLLRTRKIPTIAVKRIMPIVFSIPIFDPTVINILISMIGIIIKIRKIIQKMILFYLLQF